MKSKNYGLTYDERIARCRTPEERMKVAEEGENLGIVEMIIINWRMNPTFTILVPVVLLGGALLIYSWIHG